MRTNTAARLHRISRIFQGLFTIPFTLCLGIGGAHGAALNAGDVLIADELAGVIRHYSAAGTDLGAFATGLAAPAWITTDDVGNIYVSEYGAARIHKFSPAGVNLLTITTPFTPGGVRVSSDGTIYVANYGDGADRGIYRYSALGAPLGLFARPPGISGDFIAFDAQGNLYAPNFSTGAVLRVSPTGVALGAFTTLPGAEGVAFDESDNVYISSYSSGIIERYSPSGTDLGTFASIGPGAAYGLAFDGDGSLYVADFTGGNIRKFSAFGVDLGVFVAGLAGPRDVLIVSRPPLVSFASLAAGAQITLRPGVNDDQFAIEAIFTLGAGSDGVNPPTDVVILQVDTVYWTIAAGSFTRNRFGGFVFQGVVGGTQLGIAIQPLGGGRFGVGAAATGANLAGTMNPVQIGLAIGNDGGSTAVTARLLSRRR